MRLLAAALLLSLVGCGGKQIQFSAERPDSSTPITVDHAVRIFSAYGFASACAVEDYVLTAHHVAAPFAGVPFLHDRQVGYAWSDPSGRAGLFDPVGLSAYRDLGLLAPIGGDTPVYQTVSVVPPQEGDIVRWVEYHKKNDDEGDFFAPEERSATVVRLVGGSVTFDEGPTTGASGTCLFNADGEVLGIVVWGFDGTGVAVLVVDAWWLE